jgi:putative N6-adenine-specific DNA methylase
MGSNKQTFKYQSTSVKFFIICPLGFEEALTTELKEFWPDLLDEHGQSNSEPFVILEEIKGGLEIECSLILGLQINLFSKLASRVLLRIAEFKARDFPKLHEKLKKLRWQEFWGDEKFLIQAQASKSRLNNEKRILETALSAWPMARLEEPTAEGRNVFLRMHDDLATVSVDTTGRHLHFRRPQGQVKKIGEAPLRETLAAFMIRNLMAGWTLPELKQISLWDPMAGSGTLLEEAQGIYTGNFTREYSFQNFKLTPKILKNSGFENNFPGSRSPFSNLFASDQEPSLLNASGSDWTCFEYQLDPDKGLDDHHQWPDSLKSHPKSRLWIVCNPPYNQRLENTLGTKKLARALKDLQAAKVSVLVPKDFLKPFEEVFSKEYELTEKISISNGGLSVLQLIFSKK